jgi:sialate O-acetylesterase
MKRYLLKHIFLVVLLFTWCIFSSSAKIILPSVFSDNMVLQQNSEVAIWGWSNPGETVKIVAGWNATDTIKITSDNMSKWKAFIKTDKAGGPYTIQIIGEGGLELKNVMLGEVWICSGQSNMEWKLGWNIFKGEEEAAKANHPNIRIFNIPKISAEYPQQDCRATWTVCSPEISLETSAVGYFFAQQLQEKLNVPVGIIVTCWGGTPAEVWIDKSRIETNPELNKDKYNEQHGGWPGNPGVCYNSMIFPVIPYEIAGAIWYQGESNCSNYQIYANLMKTLIDNWRTDFKKDFPFYFVQIAPYNYGEKGTSEFVREQQDLVSKAVTNTGMVVVSDLVDDVKDIHPKDKLNVGKRLANYALAETYKQNVGACKSPSFKSMQVEKGKVILNFNDVLTGIKCTGKTPKKFLIAGDDKKFVPAAAKIEGTTVVLSSKLVKNPVAVRFCFDDTSVPDIFSNEGLPLAPFRTDNW